MIEDAKKKTPALMREKYGLVAENVSSKDGLTSRTKRTKTVRAKSEWDASDDDEESSDSDDMDPEDVISQHAQLMAEAVIGHEEEENHETIDRERFQFSVA
jgi:hypothetical protein